MISLPAHKQAQCSRGESKTDLRFGPRFRVQEVPDLPMSETIIPEPLEDSSQRRVYSGVVHSPKASGIVVGGLLYVPGFVKGENIFDWVQQRVE
jgi:hypothetical protein